MLGNMILKLYFMSGLPQKYIKNVTITKSLRPEFYGKDICLLIKPCYNRSKMEQKEKKRKKKQTSKSFYPIIAFIT